VRKCWDTRRDLIRFQPHAVHISNGYLKTDKEVTDVIQHFSEILSLQPPEAVLFILNDQLSKPRSVTPIIFIF